jgi:hypothetical protein
MAKEYRRRGRTGAGRKGGHGGSGAAAAQQGYGGAPLGLRRTKASGPGCHGERGGGVAGLVGRGGGLSSLAC